MSPGRPAIEYAKRALVSMVAGVAGAATMALSPIVPDSWRLGMVAIGFLVAFSAAIVTLSIGLEGYRRAIEERDRGYTTTYGDHNHLWQLDPKTGEVAPPAGERTARRRHP